MLDSLRAGPPLPNASVAAVVQARPGVIREPFRVDAVQVAAVKADARSLTLTLKANSSVEDARLDVRVDTSRVVSQSFPLGSLRTNETRTIRIPIAFAEDGNYVVNLATAATLREFRTKGHADLLAKGGERWWVLWRAGKV